MSTMSYGAAVAIVTALENAGLGVTARQLVDVLRSLATGGWEITCKLEPPEIKYPARAPQDAVPSATLTDEIPF